MSEKFIPKDYGFDSISYFPELANWYGPDTYIKVSEVGGQTYGRKVYWYLACTLNSKSTEDDRITFYEHSYDETSKNFGKPRVVYFGLVANKIFATHLLVHLLGTTKNDSTKEIALMRFRINKNIIARIEYKKS